jgi:hypothetical protein
VPHDATQESKQAAEREGKAALLGHERAGAGARGGISTLARRRVLWLLTSISVLTRALSTNALRVIHVPWAAEERAYSPIVCVITTTPEDATATPKIENNRSCAARVARRQARDKWHSNAM